MMRAAGDATYEAEIRRTTHGVAHIRGATLGDVGFGQGYACAADHLPTIADQVLKVTSRRAKFLGPGDGGVHVDTDMGYLALGVRDWAQRMADTCDDGVGAIVAGYASGINRWLADHGTASLPEWCRGADWIAPVDVVDLFTLYADAALMGSGRNLAANIGSATRPGDVGSEAPTPDLVPPDLPGSNGWAFGSDVTRHGGGIVMANPHFPWYGDGRFWECHLTIPGEIDVYGASLIGTPGVQIGFNSRVAWTHTFSRGHRFVVYRVDLGADDPTGYRFGDDYRAMTSTAHRIEVAAGDGTTSIVQRDLWRTHHGPMVNIPLLGWGDSHGFCYRDANHGNDRFLPQYLAMARARDVGELRDAVRHHQGCPWVNVIAADADGGVYYSDPSPTPKLSEEAGRAYETAVDDDVLTSLFASQRVALLDGSDPATEWIDDSDSVHPGCVGPGGWPEMLCHDVAFNSNDPYWVPHPTRRLKRGPTLAGLFGRGLSPRTRMNAAVLAGRTTSAPSEPADWTAADVEACLFDNRSLLAEDLLDDVIDRLRRHGTEDADLVTAAQVLGDWDRTFGREATGAVLWREVLAYFSEDELRTGGRLFRVPFDPEDPTRTPHGLAVADDEGPDHVIDAVRAALATLATAGIAPDEPLGQVQFIDRSGERIPLHGANEVEGIINVVAPIGAFVRSDLAPAVATGEPLAGRTERTGIRQGGYPVTYGASFLMVCELGSDGPRARGLLAYGQSGDPASPHHTDQTWAFSRGELRPLLFDDDDIAADPTLSSLRIRS